MQPPEVIARMDALYQRLVPGAAAIERPKIPMSKGASWIPTGLDERKGAA